MPLTKNSSPQEIQKVWADELEKNPHLRRTRQLGSVKGNKRCCLGKLCDLAVEAGVISSYDPTEPSLPFDVYNWVKMADEDSTFSLPDGRGRSLAGINDEREQAQEAAKALGIKATDPTWVIIANIIRKQPEGLFLSHEDIISANQN